MSALNVLILIEDRLYSAHTHTPTHTHTTHIHSHTHTHSGDVDVGYSVTEGSLRTLMPNESLATPTEDFVEEMGVVRLVDGQQSAVIPVRVVDEVIPELDEVFLVRLTSVTLVGGDTSTLPPLLGANNVSEVVIPANDSPQGEMTFEQST